MNRQVEGEVVRESRGKSVWIEGFRNPGGRSSKEGRSTEGRPGVGNKGMQKAELGREEGSRVWFASPPCYVDAIKGLIEEGAEMDEGVENEGLVGIEGQMRGR